jgi:osmotically-inducible protein OsmY
VSRFSSCGANALAIIGLALVPACHRSDGSTSRTNEGRAAPSAIEARTQITDSEIREAIVAEFRKDKKIDDAGIRVEVKDGFVALDGKLDNLLSKARSTRIAEAIRGVRSVSNRILTSPPPRSDVALLHDVQEALRYNAATATIPIRTEVRGGVVTLTGTVGSWQEQQLVERVASGVRGVCFVLNAVRHTLSPNREPSAIADEVTRRLDWDVLVDRDPIAVAVEGSRVTLNGVVGSAA